MLRTLALLRSLQGASHTAQRARATIQRACDYRWLRDEFSRGAVTEPDARLSDGTPAVAVTLVYSATPQRLAGGRWPDDPAQREGCRVEGAHACRAAGAPAYRTLESLSRGVSEGAAAVLADAARMTYLVEHAALSLTWRRPQNLPAMLQPRLEGDGTGGQGVFLLTLKVPARHAELEWSGAWLDRALDRYRHILPRSGS